MCFGSASPVAAVRHLRDPPAQELQGPYPRLVLLVVIPDALATDVEVLRQRLLEPLEILNGPGTQEVIDVRHNVHLLLLVDERTKLQHALPEAQLVQDVRQSRVPQSACRR